MSYSPTSQYLPPPPQYYSNGANVGSPVQIVSPPPRSDLAQQRKRPKYTRSKTGCLTCRVKKIKCDETKPNCMRCTHGSRDCSWPEGVPTRKKNAKRDDAETRPSTAGSSGLSEASTPPGRDRSPPNRRNELDINLVPLSSRPSSSNGTFPPLHVLDSHESSRRSLDRPSPYPHSHQNPSSSVLSMIPESYPSRYDHSYLNGSSSQSSRPLMPSYRTLIPPPSSSQWNHGAPEPLDSYVGIFSSFLRK
ncbi:hypothetical protein D9613_000405 [Agrocybe pediades]|uniref:Zn(2)-C6 fungal-type domain-containing protein n=1 Tax=Agrocybe pediades TaxID=84607 RepID=A0A8H4VSF3_9AGAR|nr:hypothetical protein D9613_000405 [Agrocybe pediades]